MSPTFHFGSPEGLEFIVQWCQPTPCGNAAERTRGRLTVRLAGTPVWGGGTLAERDAIEWTWIELFEALGEAWPFLSQREAYPEPLAPRHPMELEHELEKLEGRMTKKGFETLADQVDSFLERHDLARALRGLSVRSLRLLRQGHLVVLACESRVVWSEADEVYAVLTDFCEEIAGRLEGAADPRSCAALAAWHARAHRTEARESLSGRDASLPIHDSFVR